MELRTKSLEQLHSDEVAKFVSREGFGFSRMPQPGPTFLPLPAPPELALPSAEVEPPAYEAPSRNSQRNAASSIAAVRMPSPDKLNLFHVASEGSFLSPQRLGYVQDRDHVAGFGGHAFMSLPRLEDQAGWGTEPTEQWAIRRLELVSILKHKTPRVYVADELPNMEKLADAPTRALGDFERPALAKLAAGEDVVTHATINRIEMLGALRAHKQCMECHDVERGQLLGAFSYTLLRDPPAPKPSAPIEPPRRPGKTGIAAGIWGKLSRRGLPRYVCGCILIRQGAAHSRDKLAEVGSNPPAREGKVVTIKSFCHQKQGALGLPATVTKCDLL